MKGRYLIYSFTCLLVVIGISAKDTSLMLGTTGVAHDAAVGDGPMGLFNHFYEARNPVSLLPRSGHRLAVGDRHLQASHQQP